MYKEESAANENGKGETKKNDQAISKKHSEKHARFSVANVINSDPKVNDDQNNFDPLNGSCIQEVGTYNLLLYK